MRKPILARCIAKLIMITGYLTHWKDPNIAFAKRQSEVNLFYYLMSFSMRELNDLLDFLINLLDTNSGL